MKIVVQVDVRVSFGLFCLVGVKLELATHRDTVYAWRDWLFWALFCVFCSHLVVRLMSNGGTW